jgi:hypothetical protein
VVNLGRISEKLCDFAAIWAQLSQVQWNVVWMAPSAQRSVHDTKPLFTIRLAEVGTPVIRSEMLAAIARRSPSNRRLHPFLLELFLADTELVNPERPDLYTLYLNIIYLIQLKR